jgi:hypothetical protein
VLAEIGERGLILASDGAGRGLAGLGGFAIAAQRVGRPAQVPGCCRVSPEAPVRARPIRNREPAGTGTRSTREEPLGTWDAVSAPAFVCAVAQRGALTRNVPVQMQPAGQANDSVFKQRGLVPRQGRRSMLQRRGQKRVSRPSPQSRILVSGVGPAGISAPV